MGYFANSAFEDIRKKVDRLRSKDTSQRRLIVTTTTFPPDVTLELAKTLQDFAIKDGSIEMTFKVAKVVADEWAKSNGHIWEELRQHGWLDEKGNLTVYRNASPPEEGKLGLVILAGADQVLDASSLADFYRCGIPAVWHQMGGDFHTWVKECLDKAHIARHTPDKTIDHFHTVLQDLEEQGCADLFQISRLLYDLPLERSGAQDGRDAEKVLLQNLGRFNLPNLIGFRFGNNKKLGPYLEQAARFFRYDLYLEESKRKNALKTIDKLLEQKATEITENTFFTSEERGNFETDQKFIDTVRCYVEHEDPEARDKLWDCDFTALQEKILKFKPTRPPNEKKSIRKLSGGPVEIVLTALWETLRECRSNVNASKSELVAIHIRSGRFKYDTDSLLEGGQASTAETQELAISYLRKLISGVDRFFQEGHLSFPLGGESDISIKSELYHDEIKLTNAGTAEPQLEFNIECKWEDESTEKKKFAWRLPETQSYRMAEELIEWAASAMDKAGSILYFPVFHTQYHEELIRAKDDEETRRVLLHAIRDEDADSTNMLSKKWLETHDPLLEHFKDLARAYQAFLVKARNDGLHSVFHKNQEHGETPWDHLRKAYKAASRAYMENEQCKNSIVAPMLMRAFLIVKPRPGIESHTWVTETYESSGVATVLHPSVLEMMLSRNLFLFACFNYAAPREWTARKSKKSFSPSKWQDYLDLAYIQLPIAGLIKDGNKAITTQVEGKELIHKIGSPDTRDAPLSTRLLLRYEGFDDDDIADREMFAETRESRLLKNLLTDYLDIHSHARDGISLAIYRNTDIQPVISGIHAFLEKLDNDGVIGEHRSRHYVVSITVFSEAGEDVGISRWMEQWKDRWEAAESHPKFKAYRYCRFSIAHRVTPSEEGDRESFARMIKDGLDVDIAVLYDFVSVGAEGDDFQGVAPYDVRDRTLKFPIVEKSFCIVKNPARELTRYRVISNPQFDIASLHLETMARIRNAHIPPGQEHVLIGQGDYKPWQLVVDELHKHAEWVVCIDASIDDTLLKKKRHKEGPEREIIGFGSGVGAHGELNFTVSTEHFQLSDILYRLKLSISEVYQDWENQTLKTVAESVLKEAQSLSGLSLVRATGVGTYIRDFMGYALARKLLREEEDLLCGHLISLDAYRHWFSGDDESRPDLLWLKAKLDDNDRIHVDMHLIECKLAAYNEDHIDKATKQIKNGLASLIPAFAPESETRHDDDRPDQRYWWLQLHRLIASKAEITNAKQDKVMAAMERLVEGDYTISWYGAVLAFWTDSQGEGVERIDSSIYEASKNGQLEFGIFGIGQEAVRKICTREQQLEVPWGESSIQFGENAGKIRPEGGPMNEFAEGYKEDEVPQGGNKGTYSKERKEGEGKKEENIENQSPRIPNRILLGKTVKGDRDVYWEFGHQDLSNRHMLIFGTSGMGKTYAIQCLLAELGRGGQNSLIIDYTNGFVPDQLEKEINVMLNPKQHFIVNNPLPINPFRKQSVDLGGVFAPEKVSTTAKRIAAIFQTVYGLGEQQFAVLYSAVSQGISNLGEDMSLSHLLEILESYLEDGTKNKNAVQTSLNKIRPFVDDNPFGNDETLDWKSLFDDAKQRCHIFQLAGLDFHSWRLVAEFVLWDFYGFLQTYGRKNIPKVVVLDEVQNLDHKDGSPLSKYLREGRKFGVSLIMATQIMSSLSKDERDRIFNAGHKLFFKPAETEIKTYAEIAAVSTKEKADVWMDRLSALKKGECYSLGPSVNQSTGQLESKAFQIKISSLSGRFTDG